MDDATREALRFFELNFQDLDDEQHRSRVLVTLCALRDRVVTPQQLIEIAERLHKEKFIAERNPGRGDESG